MGRLIFLSEYEHGTIFHIQIPTVLYANRFVCIYVFGKQFIMRHE